MTPATPPHVGVEQYHAALRVAELSAAIEFYTTRLGFTHAFSWGDPPTMAGMNFGETQIFLQAAKPAPQGCSLYFVIDHADELYAFHQANGVQIVEPLGDRPWDFRDYAVRDLDGYTLTFGHRLQSREPEPALEIERVDIPIRLERRLAAVLQDLAAFKGMSVSSCLEETLLHTFEPLGDDVASPHTKADLRKIRELKQQHGMDYDSHASYRFVERK